MKIEKIAIDKLLLDPANARKHGQKNLDSIKGSLAKFGQQKPIVVNADNVIVAGNGTMQAAKELGWKEINIVRTDLKGSDITAFGIADNRTSELAEWDDEVLSELLEGLKAEDFDLSAIGFDIDDMNEMIGDKNNAGLTDPDDVPEPPKVPITKLGDIWQLGNNRLMCGDSTDALNYKHLTQGVKVDLVFTDPPYGMKKEADGVLNDNLNYDKLLEFNKQWIPHTFDALKDNGSWYCWGIDEPLMDIYSEILKPKIKANEITFRNLITWDKGNGQGQNSDEFRMYPIADEKCLFVVRGIQCLTLNADKYWEEYEPIRKYLYDERIKCGWDIPTMKTIAGHSDKNRDHWTSKSQWNLPTKDVYEKFQAWAKNNGVKAFEREYESLRREYESLRAYFDNTHDNMNNVWHFDRTGNKERELTGGHATPKPIALCSRAIKSSSREGEIVLDVFGGSGSTLIACEQLNRTCYMMELDTKYCDVIINRWEDFTGKKAVLINAN